MARFYWPHEHATLSSLTIDPTLREGFDTTADLVNMGMTVGGKLLNGRTKYAATILDIGINGAQSAIGVNDAITSYAAGHEEWAYFQGAMAGLGFAGSGLRFHEEFEVNTSGRSFSTSMLGTGVFDRITVRGRMSQAEALDEIPENFSSIGFGNQIHDRFDEALLNLTGTNKDDWIMRTKPGQTGVDATYVGGPGNYPGFDHAELKPRSGLGFVTFEKQLERWREKGMTGSVQLWFYDIRGIIGSTGSNY